jgi:putative two-component system response regulator
MSAPSLLPHTTTASPDSSTPPRATVLVVDDERGPRESLRMILEPLHRVVQASSGAEALQVLLSEPVDLVTLDLNMPGMRGEEVMRTLRSEHPQTEIIVITGCGSVESAAAGVRLGICDYLQKPFDVVAVGCAVGRALARRTSRVRLVGFLEELGQAVGNDRDSQAIVEDVHRSQKLRRRVGGLFESSGADLSGQAEGDAPRTAEFLEVLAETLESKDRFSRGHARRVAFFATLLSERLQLSVSDRDDLRLAAFLHDLGKVGIPTDILERADALDPDERDSIQEHPCIGGRLLRPLGIAPSVGLAVRHHHEWWDGTGYPDGLAGDDIPVAARIIAVADAYDAMTTDRPYRLALGAARAAEELRRFAGVQFDPDPAREFLSILETRTFETSPDLFADLAFGPGADGERRAAGC